MEIGQKGNEHEARKGPKIWAMYELYGASECPCAGMCNRRETLNLVTAGGTRRATCHQTVSIYEHAISKKQHSSHKLLFSS